jgi:hypothetical protein
MKKTAVTLLLSTLFTAPAFAGNSGTYYGAVDYQAMTLKSPSVIPLKNPEASFRLAGGYNFSPVLAVEVWK